MKKKLPPPIRHDDRVYLCKVFGEPVTLCPHPACKAEREAARESK
jgi:hypothetical protein